MTDNFQLANDSFLVLSLVVYFVVDYPTFKMVVSQAQSKGLAPICHDKHSTIVSTHIGNTKANKAFYRVKNAIPYKRILWCICRAICLQVNNQIVFFDQPSIHIFSINIYSVSLYIPQIIIKVWNIFNLSTKSVDNS